MTLARELGSVFSAGCLGGLVNSLALWVCGQLGLTHALGVKMAPALTPEWLYPRVVWGGLWGFLFLLPFLRSSVVWGGILASLGPTLVQLFVVFPAKTPAGAMGLGLGALTPLFVVVFNLVWGLATAAWIKMAK
jgi:hypothetical protein